MIGLAQAAGNRGLQGWDYSNIEEEIARRADVGAVAASLLSNKCATDSALFLPLGYK